LTKFRRCSVTNFNLNIRCHLYLSIIQYIRRRPAFCSFTYHSCVEKWGRSEETDPSASLSSALSYGTFDTHTHTHAHTCVYSFLPSYLKIDKHTCLSQNAVNILIISIVYTPESWSVTFISILSHFGVFQCLFIVRSCFESYHSSFCVSNIFSSLEVDEKNVLSFVRNQKRGPHYKSSSLLRVAATNFYRIDNIFLSCIVWTRLKKVCDNVAKKLITPSWILERLGSWCQTDNPPIPWCGLQDGFLLSWHRPIMGTCLRGHLPPTTRPLGPCLVASFRILKVFFLT